MPESKRRGFTLVELLISAGLMAAVLGSVGMASKRGLDLFRVSTVNNELNARSGRAIDRIRREFIGASRTQIQNVLVTPPGADVVWTSAIDLRVATSYAAGAVTWDTVRRIQWEMMPGELDNDLDDNGNGMVDEGRVVLVIDPTGANSRVVLVNGVPERLEGEQFNGADDNGNGVIDEPGLCFTLEDGSLRIRLSLERSAPNGGLMTRTLEDGIALRN